MKILKLCLSAFGPYREKIEFDFNDVNSKGIFLITGATGSGKTTILDGICFALYCKSTGGLRTFEQMRNLNSNAEQATQVVLEFLNKDKQYKFMRSLRLHKVRGKEKIEFREQHQSYVLEHDHYLLLESGSERKVTTCAEDIIGLDYDQFSKVIILPQGRFKELLLANSREKSKILENLFQTDKWNKICENIQRNVVKLKCECDEAKLKYDLILQREQVSDLEQLNGKIDLLLNEKEKFEGDLCSLKVQKISETNFLSSLKKLFEEDKNMDSYQKKIKTEKDILEKHKRNFDNRLSCENVVCARERISVLERELKILEDLSSLKRDYSSQKNKLELLNSNIFKLKLDLSNKERLLNKNIAAAIAVKLSENLPCPVCGSLSHPDPAMFPSEQNLVGEDEIGLIKNQINLEERTALKKELELTRIFESINLLRKSTFLNKSVQDIKKEILIKQQQYQNEIERVKLDLTSSKSKIDVAMTNLKNTERLFYESQKRYNNLLASIGKENIMEITKAEERIIETEKRIASVLTFLGKFEETYQRVKDSLKSLAVYKLSLEKNMNEFSSKVRVSQLLSGNNQSKVPIKIFVLSVILDQILSRANIYLVCFSKYRYSLSRSNGLSARGYSGLEIEVFDSQLGGVRPIYTLSGGEMFLASLSLAFGLSDVVQGNAGGRRIDSIFIDEGFDSLDTETLDLTMQSFEKIKTSGHIIGVISHVAELRNYIEKIIDV